MAEKINVLFSEEEVDARIRQMGEQISRDYEGREVHLICGHTLSYLLEMLKGREPASLRLCTLLDKPDRREVEVPVDYTGFVIPDKFIVGYGLDYDQKYRNLPYIGTVEL